MRRLLITGLLATLGTLPGSTLRQLNLDDMIRQSTMIVRGTVQLANSVYHGSVIFSHYTVQVTEIYKGSVSSQIDFGVPGGSLNGAIQRVAGAPVLSTGQDYVLFLWTSKSGLTQIIGLSQGLFVVTTNASGQLMVTRAASAERMVNAAGLPVTDSNIQLLLSELRGRIQATLSSGGSK